MGSSALRRPRRASPSASLGAFWAFNHNLAPGLAAVAQYDRRWLSKDILSGLSVAAIALPVGLAYADLAGVPAVVGIYSAIFPLLGYALLGSSRQLIVGPDAATCLLVAASLGPLSGGEPERYLAMLPVFTLMAGVLYLIAGAARLGFIATFLSQPILTGYLNGIALIILVGQLPKLLGYSSTAKEFVPQLQEVIERAALSHPPTAVLGLALLVGLLILGRVAPAVPGALVAVVVGIVAVAIFDLPALGVAVTGALPSGLPTPHFAVFEAATYRSLFHDAAAIVLISFASGMLTAKSFARRNHYEIDANQELIAFGASNIASALVQGFPVTGADSRTAVNNAVGGKTQLVGIVAAATMLFALVFLKAALALVPTAALGAVVFVSAIGLFDVTGLRNLARMSWREGLMSLGTEYEHFLRLAPAVEREFINNGIILLKYFLDVSQAEQRRRFEARITDPVKHWKLSPMDVEAVRRWWDYTKAYQAMLEATDTPAAPWYVVPADDKRRARLNLISHMLRNIPYEKVRADLPKVPRAAPRPKGLDEGLRAGQVVPNLY